MTRVAAALALALSLGLAFWSFGGIVRGYRRLACFPWLPALAFAAAAVSALFALRALLGL